MGVSLQCFLGGLQLLKALNLGSTKLAVFKSSTVGASENLSARNARISVLVALVSIPSSSSVNTQELRMCRTCFTEEMVKYSSPYRELVISTNRARALFKASKTGLTILEQDPLSSVRTCNNITLLVFFFY